MKLNNFSKLVIAIAVSELAGIIGSVFTISAIPAWYVGLVKPALNPPAWVFGPAWTTLYALMGVAAFLVWSSYANATEDKKKQIKVALGVFGIQLFLNAIWSTIFFGLQSPGWALVNIILLWLAIVWTMVVFYRIAKPAAYFLIPYILWVSFAGYLNYSIVALNQTQPTRMINLYYYNQELDKDESGNILCSRNGLVPVEREIPITKTPIQDTVRLSLLGELTREEQSRGITSEYPLEGFSLKGASLKEGVLTFEFSDPNSKSVGGACRVGILWFQIEATAKQFEGVREVRFYPEELFQP